MKALLHYDSIYKSHPDTPSVAQYLIAFDDYISYYNSTCIVKTHLSKHSPYSRESLRLSHAVESFALARIQLHQPSSKLYINVHQVSKRLVSEEVASEYELSKARMIIGYVDPAT